MFGKLNLLLLLGIVVSVGLLIFLRRDPKEPHYELIPEQQMARSPAFGAYSPNKNFPDGLTFRQPVPGTIARGQQAFPYAPGPIEAARAAKELRNPLSFTTPQDRKNAAFLYTAYCQCCHGPTGMGDGNVSGRGFPPPLSFLKPDAMKMKDGEMFHILTHGKGNMPAHAVQLAPSDRWSVILHVRVLQDKYTEFPNVSLAATKKVYQANCAGCHGDDGAGHLVRGKYPNLPDFSNLGWQLAKTNLEISNRIEYGDEPLMPSFRYRLAHDQILGLAIFIRSFAMKEVGGPAAKPAPPATAAGMTPVQIYRAYCLACHNVDGKGAIVRPGMKDIPDFTDVAWHATKKDADLSKAIRAGGKFMPPMKDKLTEADADKMAKFVRAFLGKQEPILEVAEVPKVQPTPPDKTLPEKEPLPIVKGKITPEPTSPEVANRLRAASVLFRQYCIVCHGVDGEGAAAMRPALRTLPDFSKPAFRDQHSDPQMLISILDGKGTLMPANRGRISEPQARDLVAYIRAFAPPGAAAAALPTNEFQQQFEQLQRQWEALERDIRALKKTPPKP